MKASKCKYCKCGNLFEIDIVLSLVWPLLLVFLLIGAPFYYVDEIIRKYKP